MRPSTEVLVEIFVCTNVLVHESVQAENSKEAWHRKSGIQCWMPGAFAHESSPALRDIDTRMYTLPPEATTCYQNRLSEKHQFGSGSIHFPEVYCHQLGRE